MIRALVVDDEEPARERLGRLLSGCGVEVVAEATDGREALSRIDELAPDLVFLDIQMPGLSGLDVAASLRPPRPRIVFCTAFDQFAIDAFEHHAVDYLLKPVNRDRLARTVARVSDEIREQRRVAHEQEEAVRTQARLMPTGALTVVGLDCAGACRPAQGVSGDYYDFLAIGPDRVGLALGDVSGKGTYAGLLGAAIQARLQALAARGSGEPAQLLADLNRLTVGTLEGNRFATVYLAIYDARQRTLVYASAGHPPALVVSADGAVRELGATGPAIGWSSDARFGQSVVAVQPGDVLVISSDGVTEATDPSGQLFGVDALAAAVRRAAQRPSEDIVLDVFRALDRFGAGLPAEDDRTLVVAKVLR
jgi:sigma-B regulation protein RsbU (phosphoserine phosphatase)